MRGIPRRRVLLSQGAQRRARPGRSHPATSRTSGPLLSGPAARTRPAHKGSAACSPRSVGDTDGHRLGPRPSLPGRREDLKCPRRSATMANGHLQAFTALIPTSATEPGGRWPGQPVTPQGTTAVPPATPGQKGPGPPPSRQPRPAGRPPRRSTAGSRRIRPAPRRAVQSTTAGARSSRAGTNSPADLTLGVGAGPAASSAQCCQQGGPARRSPSEPAPKTGISAGPKAGGERSAHCGSGDSAGNAPPPSVSSPGRKNSRPIPASTTDNHSCRVAPSGFPGGTLSYVLAVRVRPLARSAGPRQIQPRPALDSAFPTGSGNHRAPPPAPSPAGHAAEEKETTISPQPARLRQGAPAALRGPSPAPEGSGLTGFASSRGPRIPRRGRSGAGAVKPQAGFNGQRIHHPGPDMTVENNPVRQRQIRLLLRPPRPAS